MVRKSKLTMIESDIVIFSTAVVQHETPLGSQFCSPYIINILEAMTLGCHDTCTRTHIITGC